MVDVSWCVVMFCRFCGLWVVLFVCYCTVLFEFVTVVVWIGWFGVLVGFLFIYLC